MIDDCIVPDSVHQSVAWILYLHHLLLSFSPCVLALLVAASWSRLCSLVLRSSHGATQLTVPRSNPVLVSWICLVDRNNVRVLAVELVA